MLRGHPSKGHADSHLVLFRRRYVGRGHARRPRDRELRRGGRVLLDRAAGRRRLRRPLRGQGRAGPQAGPARRARTRARGSRSATSATPSNARRTSTSAGAPRIHGNHVVYETVVPPRGRWSACIEVTPVIGDQEVTPRYQCGQPVERSTPVARLEEWQARMPVVTSDDDQFRALLDRSTRDLAGLRIFDPEFPDRAVVAAGAPWFMTLFGRDSLLTSWMTMLVDPDLALGHAADAGALPGPGGRPAHRGGAGPDPARDAVRRDRVARARRRPRLLRHGRRDAAVRHARSASCRAGVRGATRSTRCCRRPTRALQWITDYGDRDGDGYVEYQRTTDHGLQNQGWKDSWDSMRFADGSLAATPIALCEVQGYVYAALDRARSLRDRGRRPRRSPRR